jgi:MFS family permease
MNDDGTMNDGDNVKAEEVMAEATMSKPAPAPEAGLRWPEPPALAPAVSEPPAPAGRLAEPAPAARPADQAPAVRPGEQAPAVRPAEPATAPVPLRRNMQFQTLWAGSSAATLGLAVADVAYPLAILAFTGSPALAGLFAATQTVGQIVAGLPAGHLVDRRSPRVVLIVAEAFRALITAIIATALVMGWLTLPLLLTAALLLGFGQPVVGTARLVLVRAVVPKEQLTRALTQDEVRINGAELAGPPLGGALYGLQALAHAVPFLFTAASFVASLICAMLVKVRPAHEADASGAPAGAMAAAQSDAASHAAQPVGGNEKSADSGMLAGVRAIWSHPLLRATTLLLAMVNAVGASLGLIAVVILRAQAVSPAMIGVALGSAAVGGLAGATLVRPMHKLRPGVLMIVVCSLLVPLIALLAVPYGPWWMAGVLFVAMLGVPSIRVLLDVLILRPAPEAERGRVVAAVMTLLTAGMPAGLAVSGLLLQFLSAQATMLSLAGILALGVLWCAAKPALWQARWPQ